MDCEVVVIGGGPAGLLLALELGRRGIRAIVLEEDTGPPTFPKANATTARTMEHYRRLGLAAEIRALGLPADYPQDVAYFTRLDGYELARLKGRTRREAIEARDGADSRWPTPEPLHRVNQMLIEAALLRRACALASVDFRLGWRAEAVRREGDRVIVTAAPAKGGAPREIVAAYGVGCEGPRSLVRRSWGGRYEGLTEDDRDFMGGRMLSVHFKAPHLYRQMRAAPSWQYWIVNSEVRGGFLALNGADEFMLMLALKPGIEPSRAFAAPLLERCAGGALDYDIIAVEPWTAGYMLVADRFADSAADPRLFIAGDAAHLFTPTGGQGYNTAVDDACNLAWKLAATLRGWGGAALLASYEAERRPIAQRNTRFAREMAESIGRIAIPAEIEAATPSGEAARREFGARLQRHAETEFDVPGIHLGMHYHGSPVVVGDGAAPPADDWSTYRPNTVPGARLPHCWLAEGVSSLDRVGPDFALFRLGGDAAIGDVFAEAARRAGVPLDIVAIETAEARDLYRVDWLLVRPDQHIAARGKGAPADPAAILARATGRA